MDLMVAALPGRAASIFAEVVQEVTQERRGGLLSIGLLAALWSASTGMYAVMQQLNTAFGVVEGRPFLRARATALTLTLLFGGLVLGAFSLVVMGGTIQGWLGHRYGFSDTLLTFFRIFRWVVILLGLFLGISLIYHLAPNRRRAFRLITPGSVAATVLLIAASAALFVVHLQLQQLQHRLRQHRRRNHAHVVLVHRGSRYPRRRRDRRDPRKRIGRPSPTVDQDLFLLEARGKAVSKRAHTPRLALALRLVEKAR